MPFLRRSDDRGAAVVEVTLVLAGLMLIFLALLQLAVTAFAHTYVAGVAADAARAAAASTEIEPVEKRLAELLEIPMIRVQEISVHSTWDRNLPVMRVQVHVELPALVPGVVREFKVIRHALVDD
jgi:hypothetical protein